MTPYGYHYFTWNYFIRIKKDLTKKKIRNNYVKAGDNGNNKTKGGRVSEVFGPLT